MAMNKKEQTLFEDAILQVKTSMALRWTDSVEKDVAIPKFSDYSHGFDFNAHNMIVEQWHSGANSHGRGEQNARKMMSQNGVELFSTRLLALKAMRHEVELESAKKLLRIDVMIQSEKAN